MNTLTNPKSDINLVKRIATGQLDAVASSVPGFAQAWALIKALFGNATELRQHRAIEWIEMVRDNPTIITQEVLRSEDFQDAFAWSFEKYIVQRQQHKRNMMRNVFLGYAKAMYKDFPLERMYSIIENLTLLDISVFRMALKEADKNLGKSYQVRGNSEKRLTEISGLIYSGLLIEERMTRMNGVLAPFVTISELGKRFANFLTLEQES